MCSSIVNVQLFFFKLYWQRKNINGEKNEEKKSMSYFIFAFYFLNNLPDNKPNIGGGVGTKPVGPVISQSPKKTPRPISQIDVSCLGFDPLSLLLCFLVIEIL